MYPCIRHGDQLAIDLFEEPQAISDLRAGQVVLIKQNQEWAVHRIVNRGEQKVTKGDWSLKEDMEKEAWGIVTGINGEKRKRMTNNRFLAWLSGVDFYSQKWPIRKLRKLCFVVAVFFLKRL